MEWNQIVEASKTIKTTNIKGKAYAEVNQRVKAFRMVCPNGSIEADIIREVGDMVVYKATVKDETGRVLSTGTAFEERDSSYINKTSYMENCETSAIGRALAFAGFGIDTSIASSEEMESALEAQSGLQLISDKDVATLRAVLSHHSKPEDCEREICLNFKVNSLNELTSAQLGRFNAQAEEWLKKWDAKHAG